MQAKVRKAKAKSTKQSTAKATIRKLPKGSGIVVPVDQKRVVTHTIHVPKGTDELVIRIVLGKTKTKTFSLVGPVSDPEDDLD